MYMFGYWCMNMCFCIIGVYITYIAGVYIIHIAGVYCRGVCMVWRTEGSDEVGHKPARPSSSSHCGHFAPFLSPAMLRCCAYKYTVLQLCFQVYFYLYFKIHLKSSFFFTYCGHFFLSTALLSCCVHKYIVQLATYLNICVYFKIQLRAVFLLLWKLWPILWHH